MFRVSERSIERGDDSGDSESKAERDKGGILGENVRGHEHKRRGHTRRSCEDVI